MSERAAPIYITTPIYYVNDRPHIGHAYTTTVCDIYARFMRFDGRDVFFLTGTDEHGVRIPKVAAERGLSAQELVDQNAAEFERVLPLLGFTNDDFIRTTEERHVRQVQTFVQQLVESGMVYVGEFEGWYDETQEEYIPETKARQLDYKSPVNQKPLTRAREKNYYFKLSAFQDTLEKLYADRPDFVRPEGRRNEMLARMREGLQDVPMSRTNAAWGVPMPNDPNHVIYVWIEALMNYTTALGLAEPESRAYQARAKYWPATYHVIGKEILWFHSVIWPAVLMALDLPAPQCVYAHSFWIREGQKMSKSLGNFIDLETIQQYLDTFGLDAWRYYMATQGPLGATDSDFSDQHFRDIYRTDLQNTLGNSASRVAAMINKYFGEVPGETGASGERITFDEFDWPAIGAEAVATARQAMEKLELAGAIAAALGIVRRVDAFINATVPFKLIKDDAKRAEVGAILYQCLESLRIASLLLWPVMPGKIEDLWRAWNLDVDPARDTLEELATWGAIEPGAQIEKVALFPEIEDATPVASR